MATPKKQHKHAQRAKTKAKQNRIGKPAKASASALIDSPFDDRAPSIPVGFTSSRWGSLASFGARTFNGTKKQYGTSGNSFLAIVEFGDHVRAKAITAGGESGDPSSPHFNDQAERYATGNLRDVYFYPDQLKGHTERRYRPGD